MGSKWARFARWLGFDRNPLRRRSDRVEAALRLAVLVLVLFGVPAAAVATGRTVDHLALHQAQVQRSERYLIRATLTEKAVADNSDNPYADVPLAWVAARWTAPDDSVHHGPVLAPVGDRPGRTVAIWISHSGAVTDPPTSHSQIRIDVAIGVLTVAVLGPLSLIVLESLGRHLLDVRRWQAWESDWRITGPQWRRNQAW